MHLVSSGCSFAYYQSKTWPYWLEQYFFQGSHSGMGSQGNGMISRKLLYSINNLLTSQHADPSDLFVAISWSGPFRGEMYRSTRFEFPQNYDHWEKNPDTFPHDDPGSWIIVNPHWSIEYSTKYYKHFFDEIQSLIITLEHILRVQNYLNLHNIKYLMVPYTTEVFPLIVKTHSSLKWLYDQINFNNFIPINGMLEWAKENYPELYTDPTDSHLTEKHNKIFVDEVMVPWINERYSLALTK